MLRVGFERDVEKGQRRVGTAIVSCSAPWWARMLYHIITESGRTLHLLKYANLVIVGFGYQLFLLATHHFTYNHCPRVLILNTCEQFLLTEEPPGE